MTLGRRTLQQCY